MATPLRFRTQDTRASLARKLNQLLANASDTTDFDFREVPQTWAQWEKELNHFVKTLTIATYPVTTVGLFRISDTRQMQCRRLNRLAKGIFAGIPVPPGP